MVEEKRGRGRPATATGQFKKEIAAAKKLMAANLNPVTQGLVDVARGRYILLLQTELGWQRVEDERAALDALASGYPLRVYLKDPDIRAGLEILERVMGKVPQEINAEVRHIIEQSVEDQALLVRILEEHVPAEYLAPVLAELRRVREHHREAAQLVAG
jgi:hypothetical protein